MFNKISMTAILLAGGKSSRMGKDKALLSFGGQTVLEHLAKLFDSIFQQTLIVVNDKAKYRGLKIPKHFLNVTIISKSFDVIFKWRPSLDKLPSVTIKPIA